MLIIIDNYDSFTYNLYQMLSAFYSPIQVYRNNQISVNEIKALNPQGIILSPGPKRPENAGICLELIRDTHKFFHKTPILGVCLGHQAIVQAFGGNIIQAPEIIHGKPDFIHHNQQGIYQQMSPLFQAGRYHSLIAERKTLPNVLKIEAETNDNIIMGVKHRSLPIYGIQFHPESILTPEGEHLLEAFVALCQ